MSPLTEPTRLTLRKSWQPMDSDAAAYITAVEAADTAAGQSGGLEEKTKIAIDNFVLGCKADGIWTAIKASCILAGARTLSGALVPLVGTAPTNFNFVSGDYNRKTGLVGDGSTKYLNSNRNNNADPQNSNHNSLYVSTVGANLAIHGGITSDTGSNQIGLAARKSRNQTAITGINMQAGFIGINRSVSTEFGYRVSGATTISAQVSQVPSNGSVTLFATSAPSSYATHRLAFYSIGESLNLALLDARVTDLITAIGVAF